MSKLEVGDRVFIKPCRSHSNRIKELYGVPIKVSKTAGNRFILLNEGLRPMSWDYTELLIDAGYDIYGDKVC